MEKGDLISRQALIEAGRNIHVAVTNLTSAQRIVSVQGGLFLKAVEDAPTVDAVPVVHGRWEKFGYDFCCSACGVYQCGHYIGMTNYCPNCGAKMDGGDDNG